MSASLLDGKILAKKIRQSLLPRVTAFKKTAGRAPVLALVTVGQDASAAIYLRAKIKACRDCGITAVSKTLPPTAGHDEITALLRQIGQDQNVDAVMMDFPLPPNIKAEELSAVIPAKKDAEGISADNYGRLFAARHYDEILARRLIAPPTAMAVAELLLSAGSSLEGKTAAVVGRSLIVGKPAAHLLSLLNLTVTLCHSKTLDLKSEIGRADVVVAAAGQANIIRGTWIKKGAVVIDAGVNEEKGALCGDVEFDSARKSAAYITPVPGGVGPVTTELLLANTLTLAENRIALKA